MTYAIRVEVEGAGLIIDELGRMISRVAPKWSEEITRDFSEKMAEALIKSAVDNKISFTGKLVNNIRSIKSGDKEYVVTMPRYGHYVSEGTPAGYIIPATPETISWAEAKLTWVPSGQRFSVFRKIVKKRGTRGRHWIKPVIQQEAFIYKNLIKKQLSKEFK